MADSQNGRSAIALVVAVVGLAVNFAGFIWTASTVNSAIEFQKEQRREERSMLLQHERAINEHTTRITVLEKEQQQLPLVNQ